MGEPIVLDDEFYEFVARAYRLDPETGRRRYRRAFLSRVNGGRSQSWRASPATRSTTCQR
jgi:hypothetical protein